MIRSLLANAVSDPAVETALSDPTFLDRVTLVAVDAGIVVIVAGMLLCVLRLLRGPHLADRAVAVDTLTVHLVALVVLLTMRAGALFFFDGVLALSLLGFVASVAMGQYIIRRRLRELNVHEEVAAGDGDSTAQADRHGEAP